MTVGVKLGVLNAEKREKICELRGWIQRGVCDAQWVKQTYETRMNTPKKQLLYTKIRTEIDTLTEMLENCSLPFKKHDFWPTTRETKRALKIVVGIISPFLIR